MRRTYPKLKLPKVSWTHFHWLLAISFVYLGASDFNPLWITSDQNSNIAFENTVPTDQIVLAENASAPLRLESELQQALSPNTVYVSRDRIFVPAYKSIRAHRLRTAPRA